MNSLTNDNQILSPGVTTVALVDPFSSGHHSMFLRMFASSLLTLGCRVVVFCAEPEQLLQNVREVNYDQMSALYVRNMPEPKVNFGGIPFRIKVLLRTISAWKLTLKTIRQFEESEGIYPDLVFFPWLDSFLHPLLFPSFIERYFPYQWAGLYFHPRHLRLKTVIATLTRLIKPEKVLQAANCAGVAILDEGVQKSLEARLLGKQVVVFPDATETQLSEYLVAEKVKELAQGRIIVSLLGSLQKRKGIPTFLQLIQKSSAVQFYFLIAGRLTESAKERDMKRELKAFASSAPENCYFHLEHIPGQGSFNALLCASDILCAVYEDFPHSSNILTKAAAFHKPVLVSEGYAMGERVRKYNLGVCVPINDVDSWLFALQQIASRMKESREKEEREYAFDDFYQLHTPERLLAAFSELLTNNFENKTQHGEGN